MIYIPSYENILSKLFKKKQKPPKFKVGDIVKYKYNDNRVFIISRIINHEIRDSVEYRLDLYNHDKIYHYNSENGLRLLNTQELEELELNDNITKYNI